MSQRKVAKVVNDELDSIVSETREYKSFSLGYAYGYYSFYRMFSREYGVEEAKRCFSDTLNGKDLWDKYFQRLVEAGEETDAKHDVIYEKYRKLKQQHID